LIAAHCGRRAPVVMMTSAFVLLTTLAACSSNKQATPSTSRPTTSTKPAPVTTTVPLSTTTTTPACSGANYILSVLGTEGAAGTNEVTLGLRNTATVACALFGYPGVQLFGANGANLDTNEIEGGGLSFTDFPRENVSVAPGATAYFNIGYSDVTTGTESSCPTASGIQIIPPNSTTELRAAGQFTVCNGGSVNVSPVFGAGSPQTQTTAPPPA
jgi:hypothetical protein